MKLFVILLFLALGGYGAYAHLEAQERRIADAQTAREKALAEKRTLLRELETLTKNVDDTCAKLEAAKTRALDQIKSDMQADFLRQKGLLEDELKSLEGALNTNPESARKIAAEKIAVAKADLLKLQPLYQKAVSTNEVLMKYVRAEEAAARDRYPHAIEANRVRFNLY